MAEEEYEYVEEGEDERETLYYNGKGSLEEDENDAVKYFEDCLAYDVDYSEKTTWGFKSLKKLVSLYFKRGETEKQKKKFQQLTTYMGKSFTEISANDMEKALNKLLDTVCVNPEKDLPTVLYMHDTAMDVLKNTKEKFWFRVGLREAKILLDCDEYTKLAKLLEQLHDSCKTPEGQDDVAKKGSLLIDVYALEIQMYTATNDIKKLKGLYELSLEVSKSAVPHPRILGVIRECGGKMHMRERIWENASTDFFEAFKNYDEAGSPRRINCLKYLVLAKILSLSGIDPFEAPETKPYKTDTEIVGMTTLVSAYEANDIKKFEETLQKNRKSIMEDPFMKDYINDLLRNIRTQFLLRILAPYTSIRIDFIAKELNITSSEVEELMIGLVLDNKIHGKIDQVNSILLLESTASVTQQKYRAVEKWGKNLDTLSQTVIARLA
eukprot:TRINITY_DN568_c1_g3_i1.p1 TRINITY_DN568_c1_g3~~TRINITY_DN568_c1_g3_i1.p1  ORF type:complete len:438 (-),score=91.13 TRINITY_DN568_c1_g3_i1:42-1355(-)